MVSAWLVISGRLADKDCLSQGLNETFKDSDRVVGMRSLPPGSGSTGINLGQVTPHMSGSGKNRPFP